MERNWAEMGIAWEASDVSKQHGDHATDRSKLGVAQVPRAIDLDKAIAAGLRDALLKGVNGTSWRVIAQDVARRMILKNRSAATPEAMRERVMQRLLSIRASGGTTVVTKEVVIHTLPDGTQWDDEMGSENEFRAESIAQYVDMGVEVGTAQKLAAALKW